MTASSVAALIGTGISLGFVHVLTGPDHLTALTTLTAGSDWKSSFFLGVRWGIGHSLGLILVGSIFIIKDLTTNPDGTGDGTGGAGGDDEDSIDVPEVVGHVFEYLVGVFMLFLGFFGFRNALSIRRDGKPQAALIGGTDDEEQQQQQQQDAVSHRHFNIPFWGTGQVPTSHSERDGGREVEPLPSTSTLSNQRELDDNVPFPHKVNSASQNNVMDEVASKGTDEEMGYKKNDGETLILLNSTTSHAVMDANDDDPNPPIGMGQVPSTSEEMGLVPSTSKGDSDSEPDTPLLPSPIDPSSQREREDKVQDPLEEVSGSQDVPEVDTRVAEDDGGDTSAVPWTRRISNKTLAVLAGIIHGLAGPGGVLGVIPAVKLHDWRLATCYLGSFCFASIVAMGSFACSYGTLSEYLGRRMNVEFQLHCLSATLSTLVGILWLILLSTGTMDKVFP